MLARWNTPFSEFFNEWDRWNRSTNSVFERQCVPDCGVFPPVNVYDDGDRIVVRSEAPGMDPKSIDITATHRVLTLKGERKQSENSEKRSFHRQERSHGVFSRSFTLPTEIDPDRVSAGYTDGVLEVVLQKAANALPRKIEVASA
jgi:HSP20 family protein